MPLTPSVGFADSSPLGEQLGGSNSSPQGEVDRGGAPGRRGSAEGPLIR